MVRKKVKPKEHENSERWLISYADFITLLFAFFVVMYATSTNNTEKQKKFENSVRAQLKIYAGTGSVSGPTTGSGSRTESSDDGEEGNPEAFPKNASPREIKDFIQRQIYKNRAGVLKQSVSDIHHEWYGVKVSIAASTFFAPGAYKLKYSSLKVIDEFMKPLAGTNNKLIIEGHTDNTPIKNQFIESNWELSSLRASSVVRYLLKYHHLDPGRVTAAAYADTRPLVSNDSEENRAKNRRIDILIISDEKINSEGF